MAADPDICIITQTSVERMGYTRDEVIDLLDAEDVAALSDAELVARLTERLTEDDPELAERVTEDFGNHGSYEADLTVKATS